jgi:DNA-binding GntR family transcriptional regulator
MEFQAFVRHEPNRGYYLTPSSLQELEEIYDLRYLLEPSLIPSTVRHLDSDGEGRLKAAMEAHLLAHREGYLQERIFKNVQFHLTLASLSNRPTQIRILRNLFDLLILKYGGNQGTEESMTSVDEEHRRTFHCVISRDVEGAKQILSQHVMNVKNQVIERFQRIQQEREMPEFT